jgi:hypothetical protein
VLDLKLSCSLYVATLEFFHDDGKVVACISLISGTISVFHYSFILSPPSFIDTQY